MIIVFNCITDRACTHAEHFHIVLYKTKSPGSYLVYKNKGKTTSVLLACNVCG